MTTDLLSVEDCTKILQNRFNNPNIQFNSFEIKPFSENVEGFLGEHYNLFITYKLNNETNTETFFMKTTPTKSDIQIELCHDCGVYKKEIFIYDILIKEFGKYGLNTNFAGKCYYCIPDKSLIFENLLHKGYVLPKRHTVFNINQIKRALKSLSSFHAAGFAYQQIKLKEQGSFSFENEFGDYLDEIYFLFYINQEHSSMKWWKSSFKTINKLIDLLPEDEASKMEFKNKFNNFPFGKTFVEKTKLAKTCGHGDLWSNNMLFKYENDEIIDCVLLDFQSVRNFYPSFDVLLLIFANTNRKFRQNHLEELFKYYYKNLEQTLSTYGYSIENILPEKDFYESIRLIKIDALLQIVCAVLVLYLPKEKLTSLVNENDGADLNNFMADGSSTCCDIFLKNTVYRETVLEALQDIREALLEVK